MNDDEPIEDVEATAAELVKNGRPPPASAAETQVKMVAAYCGQRARALVNALWTSESARLDGEALAARYTAVKESLYVLMGVLPAPLKAPDEGADRTGESR